MNILLDTNVLLDFFTFREPFSDDACVIMDHCCKKVVNGFIAAHTIMDAIYILRKQIPLDKRRQLMLDFMEFLTVVGIDQDKIIAALENEDFSDVEDCLQDECAKACGAEYIVTRNIKDYTNSTVPAITPDEFLKLV